MIRLIVRILVAGGVLAVLAHTWLVQGVLVPIVVDSGSMADAILGPHRDVTCEHCGRRFACGLESLPAAGAAVCPNCGLHTAGLQSSSDLPGDRLLIDRATFQVRGARRWEPVVFQHPDDGRQLCVKRLVGLPGETVEIRDGDIFIDGEIVRKSLAELQSMAVMVHDQRCEDADGKTARWTAADNSQWRCRPGKLTRHRAEGHSSMSSVIVENSDWLTYEHRQPQAPGDPVPGPVTDDIAYNQNESRRLNEVHDVVLEFRLVANGPGSIWLRAIDGAETFLLEFEAPTGRARLKHNGRITAEGSYFKDAFANSRKMVLALVDRQVRCAVDGREVLSYPYERHAESSTARPLAIGAFGLDAQITELQVWRDIYYLPGSAASAPSKYQLGSNEYFVLGDNSPLSEDSRQWLPERHVVASLMLGKPLVIRRH